MANNDRPPPEQRLAWKPGGATFIRSGDWRYTVSMCFVGGKQQYEAWRTNRDADGKRLIGAKPAEVLAHGLGTSEAAKAVCEWDALRS